MNIAWESESVPNIASISGGSGRYTVEGPAGLAASVSEGSLAANVPGPGHYDLHVADQCLQDEKQRVQVRMSYQLPR